MQNKFIFDHVLAGTSPRYPHEMTLDHQIDLIKPFDHQFEPVQPEVDNRIGDFSLPMLPPPKRFLLAGSKFNTSPDTVYNVYRAARTPRKGNEYGVNIESNKIRIYDDRLQLIRAMFFFKRDKNTMSEKKSNFNMLTYSIEKKALYSLTTTKNIKKRYVRSLRRISLNKFHIREMHHDENQVKRWITALYDAIKKDVPDVCDECKDIKSRIIALILQHRIGKGIPDLNDILINNLGHIVSKDYTLRLIQRDNEESITNFEHTHTYSEQKHLMSAIQKHKKNTVYKFIPTLKKTGSLNKALKALLGDSYSRTMTNIIKTYAIETLTSGHESKFIPRYNKLVPKTAKHILVRYLKAKDHSNVHRLVRELSDVILSMEFGNPPSHVIANWVKTMNRIDRVIHWHTWKDLYRIAEELHIRIRPSRFTSEGDVITAHDRYSRLLNTINVNNHANVPTHMMNFIQVDTPETFKGFVIKQLISQDDLAADTDYMGHCVHSYGTKCMAGASVIFSIQDGDGNRIWTVEYHGDSFTYMHAEGLRREIPSNDMVKELFNPLGKELYRRENKKPLTYKMRAGFRIKQLTLMYTIDLINEIELDSNELNKQFETSNCKLERLVQINRLIENKTPGTKKELLRLASLIDTDETENFLMQRNQNLGSLSLDFDGNVTDQDANTPF